MLLLPCGACYILVHGELPTSLKATEHCTSWYTWMCWAQSPSGACLHCFQSLKAQTLKCTLAYITSHVKVATAFFARQNKISESKCTHIPVLLWIVAYCDELRSHLSQMCTSSAASPAAVIKGKVPLIRWNTCSGCFAGCSQTERSLRSQAL